MGSQGSPQEGVISALGFQEKVMLDILLEGEQGISGTPAACVKKQEIVYAEEMEILFFFFFKWETK